MNPTALSGVHIGGHTRFVVNFVAEALSRSRAAGYATVMRSVTIVDANSEKGVVK